MNDQLITHYQTLLKKYGASSQAVQYRDKESHFSRFKMLARISSEIHSLLDIGCGLADFYHFLCSQGFDGKYLGLDFVPEFVTLANESIAANPNAEVRLLDVSSGTLPTGFDYGFVSGVFNNRSQDSSKFIYETLERLWNACEKGIAFNVLSTFVDYLDEDLFYVNPLEVFEFLKCKLGGHVVMYHDYVVNTGGYPYEVTFHVYKHPRTADEH